MKSRKGTKAHHDWLALVEPVGAFLTMPVLRRVFPDGLNRTDAVLAADARDRAAGLGSDVAERTVWLRWLLADLLRWGDRLAEGPAVPHTATTDGDLGTHLRPDACLLDADGRPVVVVLRWPLGTDLAARVAGQRWGASPIERAQRLCVDTGVPLALVTDTDSVALVWAPRGAAAGHGTWTTSLFAEAAEREHLDAFTSLLDASRFFAAAEDNRLDAMFRESAGAQAELTDTLGRQVRRAAELLVAAISRSDRNHGGALLADVGPADVYAAAVAVLMRLVVLLAAEERRLLPVDDDVYARSYAVSTLLDALEADEQRHGADLLERRHSGWARLLATFRAVWGGVAHDRIRVAAYGGELFDPHRWPFLAEVAVDDRSVKAICDALLYLREGSDARRISYRGLDVEQIGHTYEGLLDHGCVRVDDDAVGLGLVGKKGDEPEVDLATLEAKAAAGRDVLLDWLHDECGASPKALAKLLDAPPDANDRARLLAACDNDDDLAARLAPYLGLLRRDLSGLPEVWLPGSYYVTQTSAKRDSGTAYTTKDLADEVVAHALAPLCYSPGPQDGADPSQWMPRSAAEILDLKVCDPAVGSGAILVAACRYLADVLIETGAFDDDVEARRAVADRCLYGVDRNPMALEMAKLSLWLTTMARERPFTFLDHALRSGNALLGITSLDQLTALHPDPPAGRALHGGTLFDVADEVEPQVKKALGLARDLAMPVVTVRDAETKAARQAELDATLARLSTLGDVVIGAALASSAKGSLGVESRLLTAADHVRKADWAWLDAESKVWLQTDKPPLEADRTCLHWPLAFPEVFLDPDRPPGFDAIVGNPPFLGGKRISGAMGAAFREYLVTYVADGRKGSADLIAYFYLRAAQIAHGLGLLATNTIAQGDTREVGLDAMTADAWTITRAVKSTPWPGAATLSISKLWMRTGVWDGSVVLDGAPVRGITPSLDPAGRVSGEPHRLAANGGRSFIGSFVNGIGFVLDPDEARALIKRDPRNGDVLFPYLNGEDLNSRSGQSPSRWVINFFDWPLEKAEEYPDCIAIVREKVKPQRDHVNREAHRKYWWHYGDKRPALYAAIAGLHRVLVIALVSKTVMPAFVPNGQVYAHKLAVYAYDDDAHLGLLSSSFHWCWAWARSSTMRMDLNYSPSDVFETFPQPTLTDAVGEAGAALHSHRAPMMLERDEGLTKTYNRVHDPDEHADDVVELRARHLVLDYAVADAYGWSDLDLGHGHHDTAQGTRFTVAPAARTELLDRLLELNHARYAAEAAAGLHDKKKPKTKAKSKRRPPQDQLGLES